MADRTLEHLLRPHTARHGLEVFSVESGTAQLVWTELGAGELGIEFAGASSSIRVGPGPGQHVLHGLEPGRPHTLVLHLPDGTRVPMTVTPEPDPPGAELFRFATISDLHLGRNAGSYRLPLRLGRRDHHAVRSTDATAPDHQRTAAAGAVADALAWGAQHLVVKGDVCDQGYPWIWQQAGELLGDLPIPVSVLPGNHDTGSLRTVEPEDGGAAVGLHVTRDVEHLDLPGIRLVLVESTRPGNGWGAVGRHASTVATLVRDAPAGSFVATHHHAQLLPVPTFWPHGIPSHDATRFARAIAHASPNVVVSSGHTHRCRRRTVRSTTWTEVAATSHYPAVWAGYVVHEGGIRQTVRRIAAPEVLAWGEHTRHLFRGAWALWSTGALADRCFVQPWR
ncbi:MAG: metallophosphoesterase family protein [Microthrixaceae bacterium]